MSVASQLCLGVEPRLSLAWRVDHRLWDTGYSLLVFESLTGLCSERYPQDLNRHGSLIVETTEDSTFEYVPTEGPHYFTFLLHKKCFIPIWEKIGVVRFAEIVPSAKVAIGRIRDQLELQDMRHRIEVGGIEKEAEKNEALARRIRSERSLENLRNPPPTPPPVTTPTGAEAFFKEDLDSLDLVIQAALREKGKKSELLNNKEFQSLDPEKQQAIFKKLDEVFDPGEVSARREMRRHSGKE
jgi:hypothetical protein